MNAALIAGKPRLSQKAYAFIDVDDPVLAVGRFRAGPAVFVNLAPGPANIYTLIIAPVTMLDVNGTDAMADSIHGWMKPNRPIPEFLAAYSRLGGTHHATLVYGDVAASIASFGELMSWKTAYLG
jgi:L-arabinose isomerase